MVENYKLYLNDCNTPNFGERIGCEIGIDCGNILLGGCRLLQGIIMIRKRTLSFKYI